METKVYVVYRPRKRYCLPLYIKGASYNALDFNWNTTTGFGFAKAYTKEEAEKVVANIEKWSGIYGEWRVVETSKERIKRARMQYYKDTNQSGK